MADQTLTFGSLFAGVGGIDLGLERTGRWECRFQVEWDSACQQTLAYWWPEVPRWSDVAETSGRDLPPVDLITFGSPCQDLSNAGKRAGLEGSRSSMFFEAVRIIKEMRDVTNGTFPRFALWENVAGALTSNRGRDFGVVLDSLADIGAVALEWHLMDSQFFGVPQRRRRVFVLACFDPAVADRGGREILPVGEGRSRHPQKGRQSGAGSAGEAEDRSRDHLPFVLDHACLSQGLNAKYNFVADQRDVMPCLIAGGPHGVGQPVVSLIDGTRVNDVRVYGEPVQTLQERMGTGGNTVPMVTIDSGEHQMEQTTLADVCGTLSPGASPGGLNGQDAYTGQLIIVEPTADEPQPSILGSSHTQGLDPQPSETAWPTLRSEGGGHAVMVDAEGEAYLFQQNQRNEVRIMPGYAGSLSATAGMNNTNYVVQTADAEHQSLPFVFQPGTMIRQGMPGSEETVPTLRAQVKGGDNAPHVLTDADGAFGIQATIIGRQDHNGPQGSGIAPPGTPMFTLNTVDRHAVALPQSVIVRRLTPIECERLQGWPDNHTLPRADGKTNPDSTRYRMVGNGVTSNVAEFIGRHLAIACDEAQA